MKSAPYLLLASVTLAIARTPDAAPDRKPEPKPGRITGKVAFFKNGREQTPPTDAFVYLLPLRRTKMAMKPEFRQIHQKGQDFTPSRVVIPTGSSVGFPNDDNINHNVFSPSYFNLMTYKSGSKTRVFDKAGEYDIYCDIHVNMKAKVKVVDSDQIAPIVNGTYTLMRVPPGTYSLIAWAPDSPEVTEPTKIVVEEGQTVTLPDPLNLQLKLGPATHTHADGSNYKIYP